MHGHQEGTAEGHDGVVRVEARNDQGAQIGVADIGRQGRGRHDLDGGRPNSGHDERDGQGRLDGAEDLAAGQPHGLCRVPHVGIDLLHPHVGVRQDGRDGEHGQRQPTGEEPVPLQRDGRLNGEQREQRQRRHGPERVGSVDGDQPTPAGVPEEHAEPASERDRRDDHRRREFELIPEQGRNALRAGPVGRGGEPTEDVGEETHQRPASARRRERPHGTRSRSAPTRRRSATAARATDSTRPTMIGVLYAMLKPYVNC